MKNSVLLVAIVLFLANCNNAPKKNEVQNNTREFVPEPDKAERLKYEAEQKLKDSVFQMQ